MAALIAAAVMRECEKAFWSTLTPFSTAPMNRASTPSADRRSLPPAAGQSALTTNMTPRRMRHDGHRPPSSRAGIDDPVEMALEDAEELRESLDPSSSAGLADR